MTNKTIDILGLILTLLIGTTIIVILGEYFNISIPMLCILGLLLGIAGRFITELFEN